MIRLNKLRIAIILTLLTSFLSSSRVIAETTSFTGTEGPVSARLQVQNGWPLLEISYTGYLFECGSWSYGRMPVTVNIVYITRNDQGAARSHMHAMTGICRNYWNADDAEEAYTRIGTSDHGGILKEILRGQDLNAESVTLELAFVRDGRWDSRYGENFQITLERSDAAE